MIPLAVLLGIIGGAILGYCIGIGRAFENHLYRVGAVLCFLRNALTFLVEYKYMEAEFHLKAGINLLREWEAK